MKKEIPREMFIPYRRSDVIEMCLADGKLDKEGKKKFKTFCDILTAYYHYSFHAVLERLKDCFSPANPDTHFKTFHKDTKRDDEKRSDQFYQDFEHLLKKANFHPLSQDDLLNAFKDKTLIQLNIDVDFDAFDRYLFFSRGAKSTTTMLKFLPFYPKKVEFELFERVILLLKYKDQKYFEEKGVDVKKLRFKPGCTYIFYYKNVPKADLEILFPNVKVSMTLKDRIMFLVPAIGLGLTTLVKVLPSLGILAGLIFLTLGLTSFLDWLPVDKKKIPTIDELYPLIILVLSITVTLGGFALKQYMNYKNKWVEFLNDVTQTLFFRNISVNASVFQTLIDSAEEEECKEAILTYYHLLTCEEGMTKPELDAYIENWFEKKFDARIDFDIEDALDKLRKLSGEISTSTEQGEKTEMAHMLSKDEKGKCHVQPLDQSIRILDSIWDHIYCSDAIGNDPKNI